MTTTTQVSPERQAFLDAIAANPGDSTTRLVYADWLDEHDEPEAAVEQRRIANGGQSDSELAERAKAYRQTFLGHCGVIGSSGMPLNSLRNGIRRRRGRCGPRSPEMARRLGAALDRLADRRWERAIRGQRTPTPKQAVAIAIELTERVEAIQRRARERRVSPQEVILCARQAISGRTAADNGGTVTASSYGYRWETTSIYCSRQKDGTILAQVSRSGTARLQFPAKTWQSITLDPAVLKGGGVVGIRRKHGWDCYDADGELVGVAIPTPKEVAQRWLRWEHGRTIAEVRAEIDRKIGILAAEAEERKARELAAAEEAKRQARIDRAARLLARIGVNTTVGYDDARAVGACDAGLRSFAQRIGLPVETRLPLAEIAKVEPTWAVKLARRIVATRPQIAGTI